MRRVADVLRGLPVSRAEAELSHRPQSAARPLKKLLRSAIANAQHNLSLPKASLYISKITVDPGPSLKRMLPRAFGRATPLLKRTSHVTIVLGTREGRAKEEEIIKEPAAVIFEGKKPEVEGVREEKVMVKKPAKEAKEAFREARQKRLKPSRGFIQRVFRRKAIM